MLYPEAEYTCAVGTGAKAKEASQRGGVHIRTFKSSTKLWSIQYDGTIAMRFYVLAAVVLAAVWIWSSVVTESQQVNYFLVDGVKYCLNSDVISRGVSSEEERQSILISGVDIVGSNVEKIRVFLERNDAGMNDPGRSTYEFIKSSSGTLELVEATNDFVVFRSDQADLKKFLIFKDLRDYEYFRYDCMFQSICSIRGAYEGKISLSVDFHPGEKVLSNVEVLKLYRAVKHIVFGAFVMHQC
ncbi:hypothetical protein AN403_5006 [Pseudomonas fluorescens]|uniref:Uncharacterized protein n=2 Tax=Pseudomonas fluorescens TaxID=294 RepID=A0A0N8NXL7_PSEFL|nr:hypothetical protein AN403_5006 [Pseudomonas fluorescens]